MVYDALRDSKFRGRKRACVTYCITYILSCITKHSPQYKVLMIGRVLGGIATSLLFSAFESWLVAEHNKVRGVHAFYILHIEGVFPLDVYFGSSQGMIKNSGVHLCYCYGLLLHLCYEHACANFIFQFCLNLIFSHVGKIVD